jgi:hypothetical protein
MGVDVDDADVGGLLFGPSPTGSDVVINPNHRSRDLMGKFLKPQFSRQDNSSMQLMRPPMLLKYYIQRLTMAILTRDS